MQSSSKDHSPEWTVSWSPTPVTVYGHMAAMNSYSMKFQKFQFSSSLYQTSWDWPAMKTTTSLLLVERGAYSEFFDHFSCSSVYRFRGKWVTKRISWSMDEWDCNTFLLNNRLYLITWLVYYILTTVAPYFSYLQLSRFQTNKTKTGNKLQSSSSPC